MTSKVSLLMLDSISSVATVNRIDDVIINTAPPGSPANVFAQKVAVSVNVPIAGDYVVDAVLTVLGIHETKAGETEDITYPDGRKFTRNGGVSIVNSRIGMDGVGDLTVTDGQMDTIVEAGGVYPLNNRKVFTNVQPGVHVFSLYLQSGWAGGINQCSARSATLKVTRLN